MKSTKYTSNKVKNENHNSGDEELISEIRVPFEEIHSLITKEANGLNEKILTESFQGNELHSHKFQELSQSPKIESYLLQDKKHSPISTFPNSSPMQTSSQSSPTKIRNTNALKSNIESSHSSRLSHPSSPIYSKKYHSSIRHKIGDGSNGINCYANVHSSSTLCASPRKDAADRSTKAQRYKMKRRASSVQRIRSETSYKDISPKNSFALKATNIHSQQLLNDLDETLMEQERNALQVRRSHLPFKEIYSHSNQKQ